MINKVFEPILNSIYPANIGDNQLRLMQVECQEWAHNTAEHPVDNATVASLISELLWRRAQS